MWLRPHPNEFNITYNNGNKYEPDFVVETNNMIFLLEVKADNRTEDSNVVAKKDKAIEYCKKVSEWAIATKSKEWRYVLITSIKITESTTFKNLSEQYICL